MDMTGTGRCVCGKDMTGGGGSLTPMVATTWRECECGLQALFYSVGKDYKLDVRVENKDKKKNELEEKEKLLGIFMFADIKVCDAWDIKNKYYGDTSDWLLIKTEYGLIELGWRKRVISIDWSDTNIEYLVADDVTKDEYSCHAWSYEDAIKYLKGLKSKANKEQ